MNFSQDGKEPAKSFTGITVVVLLHVVVVYALMTGLARKVVEVIKQPIETKIIEEVKPPPKDIPPPPPPPPPKLAAPPPPFIPPPEIMVQAPPPPNTIAAVSNVKPDNPVLPPPQRTAPAAPAAVTVPAVVDFSSCAKPEYPRKSLRNEETGTVILQFLIGIDGHVVESKIERSSGSRDLDNAARSALSLCRFKPGLADGKPQQSWTKVQYVWKLE
jgi:protein TonB